MIYEKEIKSHNWTQITQAGQQGTCWIWLNKKGAGGVVISHSNTGSVPTSKAGFKLYVHKTNTDTCIIWPDDNADIYYARNLSKDSINKLCVDVI